MFKFFRKKESTNFSNQEVFLYGLITDLESRVGLLEIKSASYADTGMKEKTRISPITGNPVRKYKKRK